MGAVFVASSSYRSATWVRLARLRRARAFQGAFSFGLVFLGPLLAVVTFLAMGPYDLGANSDMLRLVLLTDLVYVLLVAALILGRVIRMIADRRSQSAGSRLHLRLTGVFAFVALVPTILVAVFAVLNLNIGLEGWFSERVRNVVGSSLSAAEAYETEHRNPLTTDAEALAGLLNVTRQSQFFIDDGQMRQVLSQGQQAVQRGLREVYLIDGSGALKTRGERSYLFDFEEPSTDDLTRAAAGETVVIEDWDNNEFRALIRLDAFPDRYLYVSRKVDGQLLSLLDNTKQTVSLYQQLEADRGRVLFNFGLLYLGFALILVLAAIWLGLWFAEKLSRPVGRLASAAARVGEGDLDVQVIEEDGDDEIATLGRVFNQMTQQLKVQRGELVASHRQTEQRRRLFDSVLSNVTAGVIGLDPEGRVDFANRAAEGLLDMSGGVHDVALDLAVPEFAPLLRRLREDGASAVQEEVRLTRAGKLESLLVRVSTRATEGGRLEGYVVAFDDVTELVSAQRMAAWGDVARRIAHEIKNPLTPIQLSAERIKRKFRSQVAEPEDLEQYTDVIVRQTNDLRRIVDEFSKFARMPEPDRREGDLVELLRAAVMLQENGQPGVRFVKNLPEAAVMAEFDGTMIGQALTNLIKNAGEATETLIEKGAPEGYAPEIHIRMVATAQEAEIAIMDNGIGLPPDRARLFEPYVTTREKGTGLGLPIVKKIIEEHGGVLSLQDAPIFDGNAHAGAMAVIRLPRTPRGQRSRSKVQPAQGKEDK
ncbi:MAG: PAS domain-containing sensor histidine kinase [Rhodobacteraceae bacterium]|nr:PAS domain-containing sensor histidine kinase [Paracoccaceae bacterium]